MSLIKCKECGKKISDKAISCPNCGCPITEENGVGNNNNKSKKKNKMVKYIIIILIVVLVGWTYLDFMEDSDDRSSRRRDKDKDDTEIAVVSKAFESLDELETLLEKEVDAEIERLNEEKDELIDNIDTYEKYCKNVNKIEAFYDELIESNKALAIKIREYSVLCAEFIIEEDTDFDEKYDDLEFIYDVIYDEIADKIYDEIYEDLLEDMYDSFYDGVIDAEPDTVSYEEWLEVSDDAYNTWSETFSDMYDELEYAASDIYDFYFDLVDEMYEEDLNDAKDVVKEFKNDIAELKGIEVTEEDLDKEEEEEDVVVETEPEPEETTEETTEEETTEENTSNLVDGMRPEFKAAMDSYEAFMLEYCEFMKKYSASDGTDLTLMTELTEYTSKYAEFVNDFNKWNTDESMNEKELQYYLDVQIRVNQKLAETL